MGFSGGRRRDDPALPPGQYEAKSFPVLSAGPTPRVALDDWELFIRTESGATHRWNWEQLLELPAEDITVDIHCVTSWSKLRTDWRGVSLDTLFADVDTDLDFVMAHSYGGYTTNLQLKDIMGGRAWIAYRYDGQELEREHGGPARLLVPHLYLWKSAKWVQGFVMQSQNDPGFWEQYGYHLHGDPWKEERYS
jgi:DMSO/TMAO reductase YedYZ molybdopterin-dependent catalytic subunit